MDASKGKAPTLHISVEDVDDVALDTILLTAATGCWSSTVKFGRNENGQIISAVYTIDDGDPIGSGYVTREEITDAINAILNGDLVGSALREQMLKETLEWATDPDYGPGYDSELCDCIVQVALFDTVVFG